MKSFSVFLVFALVFTLVSTLKLSFPHPVLSKTGREIIEQADQLPTPRTARSRVVMTIHRNGRMEEKVFTLQAKTYPDGETRSLLSFERPTRIQLLTHSRAGGTDDQWLALSSGRVRRVSSADRGRPFAHSDFYYDDFSSRGIDEYVHEYTGDADVLGFDCFVVDRKKTDRDSAVYDKKTLYIRKSDFFIVQVEFHRNGSLHKILQNHDIQPIEGIPTPFRVIMRRPGSSDRSEMALDWVEYNAAIPDSAFNREMLR